jgi:hypothetical protein
MRHLALGLVCLFACGAPQAAPAPAPAHSAEPAPAPTDSAASPNLSTLFGGGTDGAAPSASPGSAKTEKPSQITARHVLIQWMGAQQAESSVVRTREQALKVAEEVLRRAKAGEDFARLAVEFSDEPNAGRRGGSLGRFGHGQMVKQFEDAAFGLKVGEISGIVESPFGFHIIQRTE